MRELVLGILVLLCVQFAFVSYTMLQSQLELASVRLQQEPAPVTPDLSWIDDLNESGQTTPAAKVEVPLREEPRRHLTRPPADVRKQRTSAHHQSVRPGSVTRVEHNTPKTSSFESVVIRYNPNPDAITCDSSEIPRAKKRSYVAKAMPVIKKPLGWIKALGSKLN